MRKSRFTTEQIIGFIKQGEAGMAVLEMGQPRLAGCGIIDLRLVVLVGSLGCLRVSRSVLPNNSFKPTPLRGAA